MFWIYLILALVLLVNVLTLVMTVVIGNTVVRLVEALRRAEEPPAPSVSRPAENNSGLTDVSTAQASYDPRFNPPPTR